MTNKFKQHPTATSTYSALLAKVENSLAEVESKTWETVKEEIDKAVEFEQDLAEYTQEEVHLLKSYLRRDLKELTHFIAETGKELRDWLQFDVDLIETKLRNSLLSIADKTTVEKESLDQRLSHDVDVYVAGEIACPGRLRCTQCGKEISLLTTTHIKACHGCDGLYFRRSVASMSEPID